MRMKLIVALVDEDRVDAVVEAARAGGATGATVIGRARGEGLKPEKTFLGLDLRALGDVVLFVVVDARARDILERIRDAGGFETEAGAGMAFQLDIEDAVGLTTQLPTMREELGSLL